MNEAVGDEADMGIGVHSSRKFAASLAKMWGASDIQVEYRGRWVGEAGRRVVSRVYITRDDPYTDALVAGLLCDGGPIRYSVKVEYAVTDQWLLSECVPSVRARFPEDPRFCRVLGTAMLWGAFDEDASEFMPAVDRDR